MCELPSAAIVSNRCWSVMINNMSGRLTDIFVSSGSVRAGAGLIIGLI
jgi:hypothetical protein